MRRPVIIARRCLLAFALASLTACSGMPLGTMWKMRSFTADDFANIEPAQLRAAIQIDDDITIKPDATQLKVTIVDGDGKPFLEAPIPLRILRNGRSVGKDPSKAPKGRHWYLFDIPPEARTEFAKLQGALAAWDDADGSIALEVASAFDSAPDGQRLDLEIRLLLDRKDGFFTLFDGKVDLPKHSGASVGPKGRTERSN
ncbi:MAG: hypothetical protein GY715_20775 [Planctomycetes bacterium]|nr:hypothetical protein [Planctomycetota bacterium]